MNKRIVLSAAATAMLSTAALAGIAPPASAAPSCLGPKYLCFRDYATGEYGSVPGTNAWWGALEGGWNDRADWFFNQGTQCNVRIYKDINHAGEHRTLPIGTTVVWYNVVSSNKWCV